MPLSGERLAHMHHVLAGHVERGEVPGLVSVVACRGEVHVDVIGDGLRRDSIFRISSMTKPVTAVATMLLVEECRLRLDDPVDDLLPELAGRRVLTSLPAPLEETVPARRAITVRDLLTFRMGFGLLMAPPETYPVLRAAHERGIGMGPPDPASMPEPDEWMRRLGELPLMAHPGDKWLYNTGSDVLGVLISRVTGRPFETFLAERVFEPLGMTDTAFSVPPDKIGRFVTAYNNDCSVFDEVNGQWSTPPAFPSGAAGLVSTADDYLAFGRMMLANGRYGDRRVLARASVETMTTDQLTARQKAISGFFPGYFDSRGWGMGVCVTTRRDDLASVPGRFGWDGGLGTSWYSDPREDLVAILMTQRAGFPQFSKVYLDFWTSVYQAID